MANLINLTTNEYPVSETEFRSRYPQTSFPASGINWAEFGYAVVFPAPAPEHNPVTQYVREIAPELTVKGHWEQRYEVLDLDAETIAANQARIREQHNAGIVAQVLALQQKALRALVEDTDTVWLDKYRTQIAQLRSEVA